MSEHPVVAFLLAAHQRAEELARAATPDPWTVHPHDWTSSFDASIGHYFEADVIGGSREGGGVEYLADAEFIVANSPGTTLRRVAAERQILAEHAYKAGACSVCVEHADSGSGRWSLIVWPCLTVLLLAEAWGWTEELG